MGLTPSLQTNQEIEENKCECGNQNFCLNYNKNLIGTVKHYYTKHIILCTGIEDWPEKITKEENSFAQKLNFNLKFYKKEDFLLTACNEKSRNENSIDIIVYPEAIKYIGIKEEDIPSFVKSQLIDEKLDNNSFKYEKLPFKRLVLVCTHMARDKRCGKIGPMVIKSLSEILQKKNIPESEISIRASSHLGGHKYAGIVVVYPEGDWYGQITSKNIEELVDSYLEKKIILASNWRGRMGETKEESKKKLESL